MIEKNNEESRQLVTKINALVNDLNTDLQRAIRNNNKSFVSRTVLESTKYRPDRIVVLRAVTINPLTTQKILQKIVEEHDYLGNELYENTYKRKIEQLLK